MVSRSRRGTPTGCSSWCTTGIRTRGAGGAAGAGGGVGRGGPAGAGAGGRAEGAGAVRGPVGWTERRGWDGGWRDLLRAGGGGREAGGVPGVVSEVERVGSGGPPDGAARTRSGPVPKEERGRRFGGVGTFTQFSTDNHTRSGATSCA